MQRHEEQRPVAFSPPAAGQSNDLSFPISSSLPSNTDFSFYRQFPQYHNQNVGSKEMLAHSSISPPYSPPPPGVAMMTPSLSSSYPQQGFANMMSQNRPQPQMITTPQQIGMSILNSIEATVYQTRSFQHAQQQQRLPTSHNANIPFPFPFTATGEMAGQLEGDSKQHFTSPYMHNTHQQQQTSMTSATGFPGLPNRTTASQLQHATRMPVRINQQYQQHYPVAQMHALHKFAQQQQPRFEAPATNPIPVVTNIHMTSNPQATIPFSQYQDQSDHVNPVLPKDSPVKETRKKLRHRSTSDPEFFTGRRRHFVSISQDTTAQQPQALPEDILNDLKNVHFHIVSPPSSENSRGSGKLLEAFVPPPLPDTTDSEEDGACLPHELADNIPELPDTNETLLEATKRLAEYKLLHADSEDHDADVSAGEDDLRKKVEFERMVSQQELAKISDAIVQLGEDPIPIQTTWIFYLSRNNDWTSNEEYLSRLQKLNTVRTVQDFWATYNHIPDVNLLPSKACYHFMRHDRLPIWETEYHIEGGSFRFKCQKCHTSIVWRELLLAAIGEQLEDFLGEGDEVSGISCSVRETQDIVEIWHTNARLSDKATIFAEVPKLMPTPIKFLAHFHKDFKENFSTQRGSRSFGGGSGRGKRNSIGNDSRKKQKGFGH